MTGLFHLRSRNWLWLGVNTLLLGVAGWAIWLGKNWKRLHRLVYLAVPLAVLHYWQRAAFLEQLYNPAEHPDYRQPVLFALLVAVLLFVRLPFVRRRLIYSTRS